MYDNENIFDEVLVLEEMCFDIYEMDNESEAEVQLELLSYKLNMLTSEKIDLKKVGGSIKKGAIVAYEKIKEYVLMAIKFIVAKFNFLINKGKKHGAIFRKWKRSNKKEIKDFPKNVTSNNVEKNGGEDDTASKKSSKGRKGNTVALTVPILLDDFKGMDSGKHKLILPELIAHYTKAALSIVEEFDELTPDLKKIRSFLDKLSSIIKKGAFSEITNLKFPVAYKKPTEFDDLNLTKHKFDIDPKLLSLDSNNDKIVIKLNYDVIQGNGKDSIGSLLAYNSAVMKMAERNKNETIIKNTRQLTGRLSRKLQLIASQHKHFSEIISGYMESIMAYEKEVMRVVNVASGKK